MAASKGCSLSLRDSTQSSFGSRDINLDGGGELLSAGTPPLFTSFPSVLARSALIPFDSHGYRGCSLPFALSSLMHKDAIMDELMRIERDVVEGERRLAELEAQLVELKQLNEDTTSVQAEFRMLRNTQLGREQDRQRLLWLMRP